jgi:type I restriction enzyme S subunit
MKLKKVHLCEVADIIAGQSPPSSTYNTSSNGLPFYQGKADFGQWFPRTRMWCSAPVKIAIPGDILISVRAPVGPTNLVEKESCIGRGISAIRTNQNVLNSQFAIHYLRYIESKIALIGKGSTFSAITTADLRQIEIPLPPIEEQKRIADILDKADAIRRKRQEALLLTDEFLRSVFLEMFGDPVTNPRGLPKIELGNLIKLKSGNSLVGKNMARDGKHPVYGGNGVNGYHDEFMFEERKIVLGRVGVYCGAVHYSQPKSWITDNALYVEQFKRPVEDLYLIEALRYANLNQYAGRAAQPLISGGRIYPVEILFPSHELQLRFAKIQQARDQIHQQLIEGQSAVESLFASLQQRAFSGELFQ